MVLIAILFCLALQRFANIGGWFNVSWFEHYLKALTPCISKLNEWLALLLIILPILLLLALLQFILSWRLFGLFNLILAILILFLCIDARDFKHKLAPYFSNLEKGDTHAATNTVMNLIGDISINTTTELNRAVTKAILLNSFEQLFAGLLWFIVFGIYGITTYFLIVLIRKNAIKVDSNYIGLAKSAAQVQDILDWITSRLVSISYALVGSFNKEFSYISKNFLSSLTEVKKFIVDAGIASLDLDSDVSHATTKENYAALDLINRVLIIWLIVLFFILLSTWL